MSSEPPTHANVVVIGGGLGGLTAAALLAVAGIHVCVLEMDTRPGGYLAGYQRGKYRFDTAIHWLNQCGPAGIVAAIFAHIGDDYPKAPVLKSIRRFRGENHSYLLTNNPDDLRDQLIADAPGERAAVSEFFEASKTIGDVFHDLAFRMRAGETMGAVERARRGMLLGKTTWPMANFSRYSTDKAFDKLFKSDLLRKMFCTDDRLMSCLAPVGWAYDDDFQAPPPGGSQAYPEFLVRAIVESGGTVSYRTKVNEIVVANGNATEVRFEKGLRNPAPGSIGCDYVLAACDLQTVYEKMLPVGVMPSKVLNKLKKAELYDSSVTVSLGLDVPTEDLGLGEEMTSLTRDGLAAETHNAGDPELAAITVLAPSVRDSTLAPAGKGTVTLYSTANIEFGNRWKTGPGFERGADYKAFKNEYADVLLRRVEESLVPGLRDHIVVKDVATPVTHQRYTGNRGGTLMGARPTGANMRANVAHYKTPVKNLMVAGQWAEYGGGVPLTVRAGANSALLVLRKEDAAEFERLRRVVDGD